MNTISNEQVLEPDGLGSADAYADEASADELLQCLLVIARAHGHAVTRDTVLAGLPVGRAGLTPSLFPRAARRAGMSSNVVRCELGALNRKLLPCVLLLNDGCCCVLLGYTEDGQHAQVVYPELGEAVTEVMPDELARAYTGRAIYVRPRFQFDARAPSVRATRTQHWFWSVVAENRALYRDVLVAAFLINLFALAMPLFVLNVYDRVVPHSAFETLWMFAAGIFVVHLAELLLRAMRGRFVDLAASRIDVRLSATIMERVMGMRLKNRPQSVGSFAANLRAFESVRDFISSSTVLAFVDLPFALLFIGVIGWIAWQLLPIFAVAIVAILLYAWFIQTRMHELSETASRAGAQRNATLVEGLTGLETIKAIGAENAVQRRWESSAALLARTTARLRTTAASASHGALWVQHVVTVAVVVTGVYLIAQNEMTAGGLFASYILASRALGPFGQAAGLLVQYHRAATALESLDGLMKQPVERPDEATFISRPRVRGDIEFRKVTFTYPHSETPALREVSLSIGAGEHVAILGRVGSGKTSVEKLVLGLYEPDEGAVLMDGIDLRQLDPAQLRRNIGYVPQDVTLFYGSLRDNLTLAEPVTDDEAIVEAARIGGLDDFVNHHPRGFDLPVGERGERLSGGQRQEVAIARAVLKNPPVMLLDEPTASMDQGSEGEIKRRLSEFASGRTLIVVTHRTSLLDLVDRIIVMDMGKVVADGPKAEVIEALKQGRVGRAG